MKLYINNKKNSKNYLLYLFFLIISILFNLNYFLEISYNLTSFLPFYHGSFETGDNYFYYSFVKDITNFNFFPNFPHEDNSDRLSVHNTYLLSLISGSIIGFFINDIRFLFVINITVFYFLNILLIYLFSKNLIRNSKLKPIVVLFLVVMMPAPPELYGMKFEIFDLIKLNLNYDYLCVINQFCRMPNILISNIYLFAFFIYFINIYIKNNKNSFWLKIFSILSLFSSLPNFLIINTFLLFYFINFVNLFNLIKKQKLFIKFLSLFFLIFLFFLFITTILPEFNSFFSSKQINFKLFFPYYLFLFLTYLLSHFSSLNPDLKKIFKIYIFSNIIICSLLLYIGPDIAYRFFFRGTNILNSTLFYFLIIYNLDSYFVNNKYLSNFFKVLTILFILFMIPIFENKQNLYKTKVLNLNFDLNKSFISLYNWVEQNTKKNQVFLSLDMKLNMNLPAYTKINPFLENKYLTSKSSDELVNKFYSLDLIYDETIYELLKKIEIRNETEYLQQILFGYMFSKNIFDDFKKYETKRTNLIENKIDYLIINKKNNHKIRDISAYQVLYENNIYQVLKF